MNSQVLKEMIRKFEETIKNFELDEYYTYAFLRAIKFLSFKERIDALNRETQKLKTVTSALQIALKDVKNRERLLKDLKDHLVSYNFECDETKFYLQEALVQLRKFSIQTFESILEWKGSLEVFAKKKLSLGFVYKNENYILKMASDLYFLKQSKLAEYYNISNKSDPFLEFLSLPNLSAANQQRILPLENSEKAKLFFLKLMFIQETSHFFNIKNTPVFRR